MRLLMLTGQRRGEVGTMRREHIEGDRWVIPETKTGRPHTVPLSWRARAILRTVKRDGHLFPARGKDTPFNGYSKSKRALDKACGVAEWTLHDLRRTMATRLAQMETPPHIIERILNHTTGTLGGVAGIYNRYAYLDEMHTALQRWANYLRKLR